MEIHNSPDKNQVPMGIGMALAENLPAMYAFTAMTEQDREAFIHNAQNIQSKNEMQTYVNALLQK